MVDAYSTSEKKHNEEKHQEHDPASHRQPSTTVIKVEVPTPVFRQLRELYLVMVFEDFQDLQTCVSITLSPSLPTRLTKCNSTAPAQPNPSLRLSASIRRTTVHLGLPRNLPSQKGLFLATPIQQHGQHSHLKEVSRRHLCTHCKPAQG